MIKIKNIEKKYKDNYIFKNFSYEFKRGLYLVVGSSGKGKTTLLNILGNEDKKYKGKICVNEEVLYFKDKNNLPSNLLVKEVYKIFETTYDISLKQYFDISNLFNKKIKKLSLGELQLVTLNLVLNSPSKIIILDEPLSALSSSNLKKASLLLENNSKDKLIIISSHSIDTFSNYTLLDLDNLKNMRIKKILKSSYKIKYKKFKLDYYLLYFKKTLIRKIIFIFSVIFNLYNIVYINNYSSNLIKYYLRELDNKEGVIIEKENDIKALRDDTFYEIIKRISEYVTNYNANYYNSELYDYNIEIDNLYVDNAFVLTSINYIEEGLNDNEIILGINYKEFCKNNNLYSCDESYLQTLLVNKKIDYFSYNIKRIFNNEETVVLSNNRFFKVHEENEYTEYYFDVQKENVNEMFSLINSDDFLLSFDYIKIGENSEEIRYLVVLDKSKNFKSEINYSNYIVCLEKGYDCLNYFNHFNNLVSIDDFKDINKIDLKIIDETIGMDEIVISSSLSKVINKKEGEIINFYLDYDDKILTIPLKIKKINKSEKYLIYHNSSWSYLFFKDKVKIREEDLQIKNILIFNNIKKGDKESYDPYKVVLEEIRIMMKKTNDMIFYINIGLNLGSVIILILLELFYNKFKKEYISYLKLLKIKKRFLF